HGAERHCNHARFMLAAICDNHAMVTERRHRFFKVVQSPFAARTSPPLSDCNPSSAKERQF
ncbi:hypothetical protein, partial [Novipirellula rosea]|uniref:hypothetical protein n=1 Tax=Novipirellula rosea TaxID=1031540 RepID=UPI0031ECBF79